MHKQLSDVLKPGVGKFLPTGWPIMSVCDLFIFVLHVSQCDLTLSPQSLSKGFSWLVIVNWLLSLKLACHRFRSCCSPGLISDFSSHSSVFFAGLGRYLIILYDFVGISFTVPWILEHCLTKFTSEKKKKHKLLNL